MIAPRLMLRSTNCLRVVLPQPWCQRVVRCALSTASTIPERRLSPRWFPHKDEPPTTPRGPPKKIKTYPPPPSVAATIPNKDAVRHVSDVQLNVLDPTGARRHLFSRTNREAAKVGDILLVRLKNGDPFAGVCINIRHRGVDTGILLRNQLTRVGVEMWFKIFSPNVEAVEVVQRRAKRARRARLYYMRKPEHDMGSVQGIVQQYQRQKLVRSDGSSGRDSRSDGKKNKKR